MIAGGGGKSFLYPKFHCITETVSEDLVSRGSDIGNEMRRGLPVPRHGFSTTVSYFFGGSRIALGPKSCLQAQN